VGSIYTFSERVIDLAERLEDVADAAQGKGNRKGRLGTRWLILPAVGAGFYALATNRSFSRQAKGVMNQAKARATELPDDLLGRIRETPRKSTSASGGPGRRQSSSRRKKTTSPR
jgi:hypothetical protein